MLLVKVAIAIPFLLAATAWLGSVWFDPTSAPERAAAAREAAARPVAHTPLDRRALVLFGVVLSLATVTFGVVALVHVQGG